MMNMTPCVAAFGKSKACELKVMVKWECVVSFWVLVINKIYNYLLRLLVCKEAQLEKCIKELHLAELV